MAKSLVDIDSPIDFNAFDTFNVMDNNHTLVLTNFTTTELIKSVSKIKLSKHRDINGISSILLKRVKYIISPILCNIFNQYVQISKFPTCLKTAKIIPIYKNGDPNLVQNY